MGIPYYFSYLIKTHTSIVHKLKEIKEVDNLYLDSNSIIYDSIDFKLFENKYQFENYIILNVIMKIEKLIKLINPKKNVFITFDGVPPIAKLNQQKNRRYKSWFVNNILNKEVLWDTSAITPGTLFMNKLNDTLENHFSKKKYNFHLLISLSNKPGEGEHKIFKYIRNNDHILDKTIIYGMDADLIMLGLNHLKYCKQIYLFRETPHFINSLNSDMNHEENYLLNINNLGKEIFKELNNKNTIVDDNTNILPKITDYVFICFLLGNDFLPHFPALNIRHNGFTILLELYKKLFGNNDKTIIDKNKIIMENLKLFIKELALNENKFIKEQYNIREKIEKKNYPVNSDEEKEASLNNTPSWERNIEKFINPYENEWEFRYYYALFEKNIDTDKNAIPTICNNYLQTLLWTYNYYTNDCNNWSFKYNYHYPPLLIDLFKHMPYFQSELVLEENYNIIHPHILLSYVLPKTSLHLLPENITNYLLTNYKNHFETNYEFAYSFCKYFWEGHVKFPNLDIEEFISKLNKIIVS